MEDRDRILVVEDDPRIGPRLVAGLIQHGYDAVLAADGPTGRALLLDDRFDLVVLDLMLPGEDGFQLLEAWRSRSSVPVVVLTARTGLADRLRSFELGAVDWLPKPFFLEELLVRIRTRLGRVAPVARRTVTLMDCTIDLDARTVHRADTEVTLTAHEFNLLAALLEHPGRAFTRAQLAERALPEEGDRRDRTVDSHVSRIRRKLGEAAGPCVRTVFGVGYRVDLEP